MRKWLALLLAFLPLIAAVVIASTMTALRQSAAQVPQLPDYRWVNLERESPNYNDQIGLFRGQVQVGLYVWSEKAYYPIVGDKWGKPTTPPWPLPESWQPRKPPEQKEPPQWKASEPEQTPMPKPAEDKAPEEPPAPFDDSGTPWGWLETILSGVGAAGAGAVVWWVRRRRTTKPDGTVVEEEEQVMAEWSKDSRFKTGAKLSPRHKLLASDAHKIVKATPVQFAVVPGFLEMWLNDQYGDCVSAEEAFAKAAYSVQLGLPETKITDATVKAFAEKYNELDGADLASVLDQMAADGFHQDGTTYTDGPKAGVDYSNEAILQNAISTGPVKIAMGSGDLPSGAGNQNGWYSLTSHGAATDHCTALCGYGPAEYLYGQLKVALPPECAGKSGYLLYTWSTIGFVTHAWIMGTVQEAWVRNPTTPGIVPVPPAPPTPPSPGPVPSPGTGIPFGEPVTFNADGTYTEGATGGKVLQPDTIALLERDLGLTGGDSIVIPPIILVIIKALCALAPFLSPFLPAGIGTLLVEICKLIPLGVKRKDGALVIPYTAELRAKFAALGVTVTLHGPCA